ncbi:MAG: UPF0164 family protein [Spirochaetales bacterium]|jgi:hypothetical protein|nr:UPF0164 family protein [Spirochaetales bacterium]
MRRSAFFLICLLLPFLPSRAAEFSDYYGTASGAFSDSHTGLTVFPLLEIPLSTRAASMGNAYTGVFLDAGALAANPASTAFLGETELSFSHNNWLADSSIEAAAYTRRLGAWGLGGAAWILHLPFTAYNSYGETTAAVRIPEAVLALNFSRAFFNNYYFKGVAVGVNLKGALRMVPAAVYGGQSLAGLMADIGLASSFNFLKFYTSRERNFSLGLAVKNLGMVTGSDPLPSLVSAGFAYSPVRPLLLSFDFNYPFTLDPSISAKKWYLGAGANVRVTDFLSLQTGWTFPGANPRISLGSALHLKEFSLLVNYTLDLTTQVKAPDRFTLEARFTMGDEGRARTQDEVDAYYLEGLQAYAQGNLERAIAYWEACLSLNPNFKPAGDFLIIVRKTLELNQRLNELNRL